VYLVKWKGYHIEESTWEPASHLSHHLRENFFNPPVSSERLGSIAFHFEDAMQKRLRSTNSSTSVNFDLDVFQYCFGTDKTVLLQKDDFNKLPLSCHWFYNVNRLGRGNQLSFPIKCQPKLLMRKMFVYENGVTSVRTVPTEKLLITSAVDGIQLCG